MRQKLIGFVMILTVLAALPFVAYGMEAQVEQYVELDALLELVPSAIEGVENTEEVDIARLCELIEAKCIAVEAELETETVLFPVNASIGVVRLGIEAQVELDIIADVVVTIAVAVNGAEDDEREFVDELEDLVNLARKASAEYVDSFVAFIHAFALEPDEIAKKTKDAWRMIKDENLTPVVQRLRKHVGERIQAIEHEGKIEDNRQKLEERLVEIKQKREQKRQKIVERAEEKRAGLERKRSALEKRLTESDPGHKQEREQLRQRIHEKMDAIQQRIEAQKKRLEELRGNAEQGRKRAGQQGDEVLDELMELAEDTLERLMEELEELKDGAEEVKESIEESVSAEISEDLHEIHEELVELEKETQEELAELEEEYAEELAEIQQELAEQK